MKNSILYDKADNLAHFAYRISRNFPKNEIYGLTSQLRRAALSVPLNIVEGFARQGDKSFKQFLLIAYGSLKETKYLLNFAYKEEYINEDDYKEIIFLAEEVGKILWSLLERVKEKVDS